MWSTVMTSRLLAATVAMRFDRKPHTYQPASRQSTPSPDSRDMHRSSGGAAPVSQTVPAAQSPAASPAVKNVTPDGVLASPFSGQHGAHNSSALSNGTGVPVDSAALQLASLGAPYQPVASTYSSRAQSSELSAKGLQVKLPSPVHLIPSCTWSPYHCTCAWPKPGCQAIDCLPVTESVFGKLISVLSPFALAKLSPLMYLILILDHAGFLCTT